MGRSLKEHIFSLVPQPNKYLFFKQKNVLSSSRSRQYVNERAINWSKNVSFNGTDINFIHDHFASISSTKLFKHSHSRIAYRTVSTVRITEFSGLCPSSRILNSGKSPEIQWFCVICTVVRILQNINGFVIILSKYIDDAKNCVWIANGTMLRRSYQNILRYTTTYAWNIRQQKDAHSKCVWTLFFVRNSQ